MGRSPSIRFLSFQTVSVNQVCSNLSHSRGSVKKKIHFGERGVRRRYGPGSMGTSRFSIQEQLSTYDFVQAELRKVAEDFKKISLFGFKRFPELSEAIPSTRRQCFQCQCCVNAMARRTHSAGNALPLWRPASLATFSCLLLGTLSLTAAFYLPGVAPTDYHKGDDLKPKVSVRCFRLPLSSFYTPFALTIGK